MTAAAASPYDTGLDKNAANYVPLSPLGFLARSAAVYPNRIAVVYGNRRRNWRETEARCRRLAAALARRGIGRGDTVAVMAPNLPEAFEAHFGVPMAGAVLNMLNIRLDAETIAFILKHGEAKVLLTDSEFAPVVGRALALLDDKPLVVDIVDPAAPGERLGTLDYEALLAEGDPQFAGVTPRDEWDAIALNYTSGTTGNPKGVVYHHRGTYLNALGNILVWGLQQHPVYLWTLPMFHCNGWCFPWTVTALAGTHVCLRRVEAAAIYDAIAREGVTHLCGAPVVMNTLLNARRAGEPLPRPVHMMTAGSAPPAAVIQGMEALGFRIAHVYGLTEVFGPSVICAWHEEWDALDPDERARLRARQGVNYPVLEGLMVADPESLVPVARDGATMGEIFMRGTRLTEWERAVDDRLQLAGEDVLQHLLQFAHLAHVRTEERQLLGEQHAQVKLRFVAGGGAASNKRTARLERTHAVGPRGHAHMLEDNVDAALGGDAPHFVRNLLFVVVDGMVGAELARLGQLALVTGGGDDLGTQHLGNLNGRRAHA